MGERRPAVDGGARLRPPDELVREDELPQSAIPRELRKAPLPTGWLVGKRRPMRRVLARSFAFANRIVDRLPLGTWLHERLFRQLQVHTVDVPLRRGAAALDGLRIAFLSDVHAGAGMDAAMLHRVFARVAEQDPHLVLLGGDLINTREREVRLFEEPLRAIRPPLGIFAVPGNHDHFFGSDIGWWADALRGMGVQVLINEGRRLEHAGTSLWLAGIDDLTEGEPDLQRALAGRRPDEVTVLLSHHPDFFFESAVHDVDLTLAGHTHGGQILLFGWTPLKHSRFGWWSGKFVDGNALLYVGRGIGATLIPLRIGAPPEIPVLRLRVGAP